MNESKLEAEDMELIRKKVAKEMNLFNKCVAVINGCHTLEQAKTANKYIYLAQKQLPFLDGHHLMHRLDDRKISLGIYQ